jgi:hypothetical protein
MPDGGWLPASPDFNFDQDEPPMLDIQYYWLVRVKERVQSLQQEYLYEDPR